MSWNMIGHEWAARLLSEHLAQGCLRQAYLITGPSGVGRRTLAIRLAQALNCEKPPQPGQMCGECSTCQRIERMQHPDLAIIQAESVGGTLKVDQVRELQHSLSLAPYEGRYRIALLLRFEEANLNAANALLKTLEEPPPQVVLVLTAESAESLLPTIISRCEVLRLGPLPLESVQKALAERWKLPQDEARMLAHVSGGRPGAAFRLHGNPALMEQRQVWLEDLHSLLGVNRAQRFAYGEALSKNKDVSRQVLLTWLSFWRDVMLRAAGAHTPLTNLDCGSEIDALSAGLDVQTARKAVAALENTLNLIDQNANLRLALEVLLLDLPHSA